MSQWLTKRIAGFRTEAAASGFEEDVFGTVEGWPLLGFSRESEEKPVVYLSSGMHGDEPAGVEAMLEVFRSDLLDERFSWRICPVLNPVGLALGTRENGDGIDLNRDYLSPKSLEVRKHRAWLEARRIPELFLSLHEDWESSGFYYYEIADQEGDELHQGLRKVVEPFMPMEPSENIDDHVTRETGWIHHPASPDRPEDWPEAIFLAEQGCPRSYTLETPSSLQMEKRVSTHVAVVGYLLEQAKLTKT